MIRRRHQASKLMDAIMVSRTCLFRVKKSLVMGRKKRGIKKIVVGRTALRIRVANLLRFCLIESL